MRQASQQELRLYCSVGESLSAIQHLEDALSHSIVLKKAKPKSKREADQLLEKHRSYTFGQAIKIAEAENLFSNVLQQEFRGLLSDRNWLVHKSVAQNRDEWDANISREKLVAKIKAISARARDLQKLIEDDLIGFSKAKGFDMSGVRAEIGHKGGHV